MDRRVKAARIRKFRVPTLPHGTYGSPHPDQSDNCEQYATPDESVGAVNCVAPVAAALPVDTSRKVGMLSAENAREDKTRLEKNDAKFPAVGNKRAVGVTIAMSSNAFLFGQAFLGQPWLPCI